MSSPRLCVTTAFDPGYAALGEICAISLDRYARRHGFDLRLLRALPETGRPPAWAKIRVIEALFDQGYEYVLWVDADAVVVRLDADIREEIESGKDLALVCHQLTGHPMPGVMVRLDVPNTGVMLLRNSPWMRGFLQAVWEREQYMCHRWWENAAVIDLLGYHRLLDSAAVNAPDATVMAHVRWLDWNWNSLPGECEGQAPIIRHHTRAAADRAAAMRRDLESLGE